MSSISSSYIHRAFHEYYNSTTFSIPSITNFSQREFGYFIINSKRMVRHKCFNSPKELKFFLSQNTPSDVYRSGAYYEVPEADMNQKGWLGADLIFDIDADHITISCKKLHDIWSCDNCGKKGQGITPNLCPSCKKKKFKVNTWPCKSCLDSAKIETKKLISFLEEDFGFSNKEIHVFFSGHRGYHVHVENDAVKKLDSVARKEISDYITGLGINAINYLKEEDLRNFRLSNSGWHKRLKMGLQNFLSNASNDDLKTAGIVFFSKRDSIIAERNNILKRCIQNGMWGGIQKLSSTNWTKLFNHVINLESSQIDTVVTTDIHRLIRLNNTLHGKTGFKKVEFSIDNINSFDPFLEAIAFKGGKIKLLVSNAPSFKIGDTLFGPFINEEVELPTAAAILLICKNRAKLV